MNIRALLCAGAALALVACGPAPTDPRKQIGAHPYLPDIHQYLLPPMHVVKNVGWNGAIPHAAPGLTVKALASGLKNGVRQAATTRPIQAIWPHRAIAISPRFYDQEVPWKPQRLKPGRLAR